MMKFYKPVEFEYKGIQEEFQTVFEEKILKPNIFDHKGHDFRSVDIKRFEKYKEFNEFLKENNLSLMFCMLFWCKPFSRGNIHKDLGNFGLNIPISGIGGEQVWVEVDPKYPPTMSNYGDTSKKKFELFPLDTPYTVVERYTVVQPTMVNTGFRHFIDNASNDQYRIIVSMRFHQSDSTTPLLLD